MNSIRVRLLIVLLAVGMLPMVAVMLSTNSLTRAALEDSEREKIGSVNREVARQIKRVMESAANDLVALKGNQLVSGADTPMDERVAEMRRLVRAYRMFNDITLYDSGGLMVRSTTDENHPEPVEKTLWFKNALESGSVVTSRPHRVIGKEGLHLKVYIPLSIAGESEGFVLRARLGFGSMWELIDGIEIGEQGQAFLIDSRGTLIAGQDKTKILRPFMKDSDTPFWDRESGLVDIEGEEFYFHSIVVPVADTKVGEAWVVACLRPRFEVLAAVKQAVGVQQRILICVLLGTGLLGVWVARRFAAPVIAASLAARRVSEGSLQTRVPEQGATELKQLAASFNSMVDEVEDHRYKLESIVDSRTESLRVSQRELEDTYAQLRASYDAAKDGILVVGSDDSVIAANQRVVEYFDVRESLGEMRFSDFRKCVTACFSDDGSFRDALGKVALDSSISLEVEWELANPQERILVVYSAPVKNPRGHQIARLWSFHDVTEQRHLQKGLEQAQKMEAVGRLAGGVAHDFNNLLTGIIGNLSLVEMNDGERKGEDPSQLIASAKRAGQRAAELVKQLLGFSRQSHLNLDYCNANDVIEDVRSLLSTTINPKVTMELDCEEGLWSVEADGTQVEQVVMNMCVNAIDAMGGAGGCLRLSSRNVRQRESEGPEYAHDVPGDYVAISVEDEGSGMPPDILSKIFEPFFTTKEQGKGTGLGLATSYGIVKQHGGWISCDSEVGKGTKFQIFLPRKDVLCRPASPEPVTHEVPGKGNETLLLVDDEVGVRRVAEGVLKHHGYEILSAEDGMDALDVYEENKDAISLVLLDLTMPRLSGKETLVELRKRYGDVPVVVCSGYLVDLQGFEEETGFRPEAAIQKPYNIKDLASKIREVLDRAAGGVVQCGS
ncbi:MAG: response regulator [Verrucomicrobiaceae bacterium]|nr:response regulator [Verrucomicrobiaceae bacterium]